MNDNVFFFTIALGGYEKLFNKCIDSQRAYCQRHGYNYLVVNETPRSLKPVVSSWMKIPLIVSSLNSKYEWVVFIDADCEIRENAPCFIRDFGSINCEKSIFMAPGFSGRLNAGVIFVRNTSATLEFLNLIISNADIKVPLEDQALYENGHVIHFAKNNKNVFPLEHQLWNNNSNLSENCYIQHYSGGHLRRWYLENMNSNNLNKVQSSYFSLFINLLIKFKNRFKRVESISITDSIQELMPFYKEKFQEFK